MPLDWNEVKRRYGSGFLVPTVAGGKTLEVTAADEERIYIRTPLWKDELQRTHLETAVSLIEDGRLTRHPGHFAEEYRHTVADVRGSCVAHILKDLGFLD